MRAPIDPCGQLVFSNARDDNRHVAHEGRLEVAGIGNFGFEREEAPGRSAKNLLLLAVVDLLRAIDVERDRDPSVLGKRKRWSGIEAEVGRVSASMAIPLVRRRLRGRNKDQHEVGRVPDFSLAGTSNRIQIW